MMKGTGELESLLALMNKLEQANINPQKEDRIKWQVTVENHPRSSKAWFVGEKVILKNGHGN